MTETQAPLCPLCSSRNLQAKPFQYLFRGRELRGYACADCGAIFIHPQPSAEELRQLYAADYFEGGDFRCGHEGGYCDPETLEHVGDVGLLFQIQQVKPTGRFLEIGCAGGAFLDAARKAGFTVQGVELSEDASRIAREKFGLSVFTGNVQDARFSNGSFDVVFMGDVIEHLPDPVSTLREIHRISAPGGLLVLALPSQTNTLFSRVGFAVYGALGKRTTIGMPPYHLFEYRPDSLRFLLQKCGFRIQRLDQGIIPPSQINLRGPAVQRLGKKLLQYPNWMLTHFFGALGDRLTAYAIRESR